MNPGEVHNGCASNRKLGWGYFMIYPHLSLIRTALNQLGLDDNRLPVFPESVFKDPEFAHGLIRFMDAFDAGDPEMKLEAVFLELLHLMISSLLQEEVMDYTYSIKLLDLTLLQHICNRLI